MDLYDSSRMGDIIGVFDALARSANPNWVHMVEGNKTCLHACAVSAGAMLGEDEMSDDSIHDASVEAEDNIRMSQIIHVESPSFEEKLDEDTHSPIELMLGNNHMRWAECAELLIKNGANRNSKDSYQLTPLEAAEQAGVNQEMISYLKNLR